MTNVKRIIACTVGLQYLMCPTLIKAIESVRLCCGRNLTTRPRRLNTTRCESNKIFNYIADSRSGATKSREMSPRSRLLLSLSANRTGHKVLIKLWVLNCGGAARRWEWPYHLFARHYKIIIHWRTALADQEVVEFVIVIAIYRIVYVSVILSKYVEIMISSACGTHSCIVGTYA